MMVTQYNRFDRIIQKQEGFIQSDLTDMGVALQYFHISQKDVFLFVQPLIV